MKRSAAAVLLICSTACGGSERRTSALLAPDGGQHPDATVEDASMMNMNVPDSGLPISCVDVASAGRMCPMLTPVLDPPQTKADLEQALEGIWDRCNGFVQHFGDHDGMEFRFCEGRMYLLQRDPSGALVRIGGELATFDIEVLPDNVQLNLSNARGVNYWFVEVSADEQNFVMTSMAGMPAYVRE